MGGIERYFFRIIAPPFFPPPNKQTKKTLFFLGSKVIKIALATLASKLPPHGLEGKEGVVTKCRTVLFLFFFSFQIIMSCRLLYANFQRSAFMLILSVPLSPSLRGNKMSAGRGERGKEDHTKIIGRCTESSIGVV